MMATAFARFMGARAAPLVTGIALSAFAVIGASPEAPAAEVRASATTVLGRQPAASLTFRPGRIEIASDLRGRSRRFHVLGTAPRWIDSWAAGHLAVRWARGASGLSASPGPGSMLSGGTTLAGGGLRLGAGRRTLLIAGGRRPTHEAAVFLAATQGGAGLLLTARPMAGRRWIADPVASLSLSLHRRRRSGEVEIVAGPRRSPIAAARVGAQGHGLSTQLDLRLRGPHEPGVGELATTRSGGPTLDLEIRSNPGGMRATLGARAVLPAGAWPRAQNTAKSRSFLEVASPLAGGSQAEAVFRGELRRDSGIDLSRFHGEIRTPISRVGVDWTAGGGLLVRLRVLWRLPAAVAIETGAASWSGPVARSGVSANLPAVAEGALGAPLAHPGDAGAAVIDWQPGRVRVRLGVSMRQLRHGPAETRMASRIDFVFP